jgi:HSP20 family molecular chaperone IbpA
VVITRLFYLTSLASVEPLSDTVDVDNAKAILKDGMLNVAALKTEKSERNRIEIK